MFHLWQLEPTLRLTKIPKYYTHNCREDSRIYCLKEEKVTKDPKEDSITKAPKENYKENPITEVPMVDPIIKDPKEEPKEGLIINTRSLKTH